MFGHAILASRSSYYKYEQFTSRDVTAVMNFLRDASNNQDFKTQRTKSNEWIFEYLSKTLNSQLRFQQDDIGDRLGRAYALFDIIPSQHCDYLKLKHKTNYVNIPAEFESKLGISIESYLVIGFAVMFHYFQRFSEHFQISEELEERLKRTLRIEIVRNRFVSKTIGDLINDSKERSEHLFFTPQDLVLSNKEPFSINNVELFLSIVSRTTDELREYIKTKKEFNEGALSDRVSPLEFFPIVKINENKYILPNFRYFYLALTTSIYYNLKDQYPNQEFSQLFGTIQEIYIESLLREKLPQFTLIPETRYCLDKQEYEGPDFTLIDKDNKKLIVVESKTKHMSIASRLAPVDRVFWENLKTIFTALKKLEKKIDCLFSGLKEYKEFQTAINNTDKNRALCVIIVGEGILYMQEALNYHLRNTSNHFLHTYPYPFCIMDLKTFELAAAIAATLKKSLYDLLIEYWELAKEIDTPQLPVEYFGNFVPPKETRHATKYSDLLLKDIRNRTVFGR